MKTIIVTACVLCLCVAAVSAQTAVVNPTEIVYTASADHGVTLPDGTVVVARYEVRFFAPGATSPVSVADLGKPTPVANVITQDLTDKLVGVPVSATVQYVAKVAAMGPTGEGVSAASNPFMRVGPPAAPATPLLRKR